MNVLTNNGVNGNISLLHYAIIPVRGYEAMNNREKESKILLNFKRLKKKLDSLYWKHHPGWFLKFKKHDDEEFKPVEGYQGFYFISNYGQVVSFHREPPSLVGYTNTKNFLIVPLALGGAKRVYYVHELVFNHFVGRQGDRQVIHKNGNARDNYYKNLRLRRPGKKSGDREGVSQRVRPVLQFDKEGKFICEYPSITRASIETPAWPNQINKCIKGKSRLAGGYQWRAKDDPLFSRGTRDIEPVQQPSHPHARSILQFQRNGIFIREYRSISEASIKSKTNASSIVHCAQGKLKTAGGFRWYYRDHPRFHAGIGNIRPLPRWKSPNRKAVLQFSMEGNFLKEFPSITAAVRSLDPRLSSLNECLKGNTRSAGGFQWRYKNDPLFKNGIVNLPPVIHRVQYKPKPVLQFSREGEFLQEFPSLFEAMRISGVSRHVIMQCIEGKKPLGRGYQWRLKSDLVKGKRKKIRNIEPVNQVPPGPLLRPLYQFSLEGKFIRQYPSVREAERKTGIMSIHGALTKRYKTAGGFLWRYKDDPAFRNGITDIDPLSTKRRPPQKKKKFKQIPIDYHTPVLKFDKKGKFLHEYPSLIVAHKASGVDHQHIVQCSRGKEKCAGGFQWRFKNDPVFKNGICDIEPAKMDYITIPVLQFDVKGNYIAEYPSYAQASRVVGVQATSISNCARGLHQSAAGYQWRLKNDPMFKNGIVNIPPLKKVNGVVRKDILQFSLEGKFIKRYPSMMAAARAVDLSARTIRAAVCKQCKSAGGSQWCSINDPRFEKGIVNIEPLRYRHDG